MQQFLTDFALLPGRKGTTVRPIKDTQTDQIQPPVMFVLAYDFIGNAQTHQSLFHGVVGIQVKETQRTDCVGHRRGVLTIEIDTFATGHAAGIEVM